MALVFRGNLARDSHNGIDEIATIPTKFEDSEIYTRNVVDVKGKNIASFRRL